MLKTKLFIVILVMIGFTSCNNYGEKVTNGHIETYYKDGITIEQAKRAAQVMYNIDEAANNPKVQKSFQLCKKNDSICFRMVINEEKAKEIPDISFIAIATIISDSVFHGAPVNMDLTNNTFGSIKYIPYKKMDLNNSPAN